jgi:starch phosphorylase
MMSVPTNYFLPPMPQGLEGLAELALDLRWSWNHAADRLWQALSPDLWERTNNPWFILQTIAANRLETMASDVSFRKLLDEVLAEYYEAAHRKRWFETENPGSALNIAFFCMEFGLSEALPIYSGGLGILAGDYLKTASDLGIPAVGVGLLYQQGYFRQVFNAQGGQLEYYPYNDPGQLPVVPVREQNGEWLRITLDLPGRELLLRVWEARVGRVTLYLMDSNEPYNSPADRGITSELYGGESEMRLQQEIVLGIGGWRVLVALNIEPEVCHLNEGHAALAVMERTRCFMKSSGKPFDIALAATRAGNIFTTHTPVEAGFDRFSPQLINRYLGHYIVEMGVDIMDFLKLGRQNPADINEPFNMAYLALRGAGAVNAVSRLHSEVSRRIFQPLFPRWPQREVPIGYVTNGVHISSWDSAAADKLWTEACGKERWLGTLETIIEDLKKVADEDLWKFRLEQTRQLILYIRQRLAQQLAAAGASKTQIEESNPLLSPEILTVGFARRFTSYKRPNLLLHSPDRLIRILNLPGRPVQMIIAGKAHPRDDEGKALVQAWSDFIRRPGVRQRVIFIADYDIALAGQLVQGVDLWINTPRRPWEACGTSGMKVLVNGGLNLSERDGWWAEAFRPEVGWAIGDGQEHDSDPEWDREEAEQLYSLLENEVVPSFYDRDERGIPTKWIERMRTSMSELTPQFSTNRMLREYVEKLYLPALQRYLLRVETNSKNALQLHQWRKNIQNYWPQLGFGKLEIIAGPGFYDFSLPVHPGNLDPGFFSVQVYADTENSEGPEIHPMIKGDRLPGPVDAYLYHVRVNTRRPADHYTPRIIPAFEGVSVPLEANQVLWYDINTLLSSRSGI